MRILTLSLSASLLSGCAWMSGPTPAPHNHYQPAYQNNGYNQAQQPSGWNFEGSLGAEEITGGNVLPTAIGGSKIEVKDAYKTGWRATGGLSYDVAPRTTLIADGFYRERDSQDDIVDLGTISGQRSFGTFSDQKAYGAEIGFREYASNSGFRPYIGATVGAAYVEAVDIERQSTTGATDAIGTTRLYNGDWVPTASGIVGVEFSSSRHAAIALESGLRYEGKRDIAIAGFGKGDDSYSVPLKLRGRFRF